MRHPVRVAASKAAMISVMVTTMHGRARNLETRSGRSSQLIAAPRCERGQIDSHFGESYTSQSMVSEIVGPLSSAIAKHV